jgi:hypothetical protein
VRRAPNVDRVFAQRVHHPGLVTDLPPWSNGGSLTATAGKYLGEFFPAHMPEGASGKVFLEFFQTDKETGRSKGIVGLILREEEL